MQPAITEYEYVTYSRYLEDIKVVEQCVRKNELSRIKFNGHCFEKLPVTSLNPSVKSIYLPKSELEKRVAFINAIHCKLEKGSFKERSAADFSRLAAQYYNTHKKVINAWNSLSIAEKKQIDRPSIQEISIEDFSRKSVGEVADEQALTRYFDLLKTYPKLKREGDLNDWTKGAYEILYDVEEIQRVQKIIYQNLYKKLIDQGTKSAEAHRLASDASRPGVVCEDQFWVWIRDVVRAPSNHEHTYNRMIWKCDLERVGGAAALPVITFNEGQEKKIVLQLAFRHATSSWEFEIPRGASKSGEMSLDTARREMQEETGCVSCQLVSLGTMTPDSGLVASIVPIFLGEVVGEQETKYDKTEAIKGKFFLLLTKRLTD